MQLAVWELKKRFVEMSEFTKKKTLGQCNLWRPTPAPKDGRTSRRGAFGGFLPTWLPNHEWWTYSQNADREDSAKFCQTQKGNENRVVLISAMPKTRHTHAVEQLNIERWHAITVSLARSTINEEWRIWSSGWLLVCGLSSIWKVNERQA